MTSSYLLVQAILQDYESVAECTLPSTTSPTSFRPWTLSALLCTSVSFKNYLSPNLAQQSCDSLSDSTSIPIGKAASFMNALGRNGPHVQTCFIGVNALIMTSTPTMQFASRLRLFVPDSERVFDLAFSSSLPKEEKEEEESTQVEVEDDEEEEQEETEEEQVKRFQKESATRAKKKPFLQKIEQNHDHVLNEVLIQVAKNMPRLEFLSIRIEGLDDIFLEKDVMIEISTKCPLLHTFELPRYSPSAARKAIETRLFEESLIANSTNLTSIDLSYFDYNCGVVGAIFLEFAKEDEDEAEDEDEENEEENNHKHNNNKLNFAPLRTICIAEDYGQVNELGMIMRELFRSKRGSDLRHLDISYDLRTFREEWYATTLARYLTKLESLITRGALLSSPGLTAIAKKFGATSLTTLCLAQPRGFNDGLFIVDGLLDVARHCKLLRSLDISGAIYCKTRTHFRNSVRPLDDILNLLGENDNGNLTEIFMDGCTWVASDDGLTNFFHLCGRQLKKLSIGNMNSISDAPVLRLAQELSGCNGKGLIHFAVPQKEEETNVSVISSSAIAAVIEASADSLYQLDVSGCGSFSEIVEAIIHSKCYQIRKISHARPKSKKQREVMKKLKEYCPSVIVRDLTKERWYD
jgi:hypothetical protein